MKKFDVLIGILVVTLILVGGYAIYLVAVPSARPTKGSDASVSDSTVEKTPPSLEVYDVDYYGKQNLIPPSYVEVQ